MKRAATTAPTIAPLRAACLIASTPCSKDVYHYLVGAPGSHQGCRVPLGVLSYVSARGARPAQALRTGPASSAARGAGLASSFAAATAWRSSASVRLPPSALAP